MLLTPILAHAQIVKGLHLTRLAGVGRLKSGVYASDEMRSFWFLLKKDWLPSNRSQIENTVFTDEFQSARQQSLKTVFLHLH